jgi:hypothetical protein
MEEAEATRADSGGFVFGMRVGDFFLSVLDLF